MFSDIDQLMDRMGYDALVVYGESTASCPELAYFVRTAIPRGGIYVKKKGAEPLLVVSNLDLGCAKKGIVSTVKSYGDYGLRALQKRYGPGRAFAELLTAILRSEGVSGSIALAGRMDVVQSVFVVDFLRRRGFRVAGSAKPTIVDLCRRTKDEWEIDRIRDAGKKTVVVVQKFEKVLEESKTVNGKVVFDGSVLSTNGLKKMVRVWCAEEGLSLVEGFILAVGPESADPHYVEDKDTVISEGEPILFDIYPAEATGYRYDFTRTYCVGRPRPLLRKMYQDVLDAQQTAFDAIKENIPCEVPFTRVCQFLRSKRWPTPLDREVKDRGFIHGLGHGIGLSIGEEPYLTRFNRSKLVLGDVVTVEPGLYQPGFGGVRLEDVVTVTASGFTVLAEHRKQLEF
ncbi:MAG: Xaa-Pro peptidase family protein [Candidatus Caldarchaeum sp.]|nr:Xaa-Pro peptidase family protein [Candidatus Caldarchaeum sp.]